MPDGSALATRELDPVAIESLVMRGDISMLKPVERARYYTDLCDALGFNPLTQPIEFITFQGKLIPYVRKGGADQLARRANLDREIIEGPEIVDVAGTKLCKAVCRVTLPNGRKETATATCPIKDIENLLMKTESKAKRRGTLSILGLGMVDESELDTMPGARRVSVAVVTSEENIPGVVHNAQHSEGEAPPAQLPAPSAAPSLLDQIRAAADMDALAKFRDTMEKLPRGSAERKAAIKAYSKRGEELAKAIHPPAKSTADAPAETSEVAQ